MKYGDLRFTEKQVKRILAEAAEREARDQGLEERTIGYNELVQIAQEAQINPKYLKVSTKQLVKEAGGLEKVAAGMVFNKTKDSTIGFLGGLLETPFILPTVVRRFGEHKKNKSRSLIDKSYEAAIFTWGLGTQMLGAFPVMFYAALAGVDLAIPTLMTQIATNLGSGFYEWYRYEKSKLLKEINGNKK